MNLKEYYIGKPCGIGGSYNIQPLIRHPAIKRWARNFKTGSPSFLDAGCGGGLVAKSLMQALSEVHGIRFGRLVGIDFVRERPNVFAECDPPLEFVESNMDGTEWPLPSDAYDFILCNHVLEHVFHTEQFIREIRRVLRPGGIAVLNVPNASWWVNRVFLLFGMAPCMVEAGSESIGHGYASVLKKRWAKCGTAGHIRCITAWALHDLAEYGGLTFVGWWRQNRWSPFRTANLFSRYIGVIATKAA